MKVAISEIRKDKVFLFLAPNASKEELKNFEKSVSKWMDAKVLELKACGHSDFTSHTSDGGKAIVSIVDVNNGHQVDQYFEDL